MIVCYSSTNVEFVAQLYVGYLNRPEMASNRLCNTFIIKEAEYYFVNPVEV